MNYEEVKSRNEEVSVWEKIPGKGCSYGEAYLPLIVRWGRVSKRLTQELEDRTGISLPQMQVLLESMNNECVSQHTLHLHYRLDPAMVTRTVKLMEKEGLIRRAPDSADNRLMQVYITPKGRALAESLPERLAEFERYIKAGLTEEEILQLHSIFERLETRLGRPNLAPKRAK